MISVSLKCIQQLISAYGHTKQQPNLYGQQCEPLFSCQFLSLCVRDADTVSIWHCQ